MKIWNLALAAAAISSTIGGMAVAQTATPINDGRELVAQLTHFEMDATEGFAADQIANATVTIDPVAETITLHLTGKVPCSPDGRICAAVMPRVERVEAKDLKRVVEADGTVLYSATVQERLGEMPFPELRTHTLEVRDLRNQVSNYRCRGLRCIPQYLTIVKHSVRAIGHNGPRSHVNTLSGGALQAKAPEFARIETLDLRKFYMDEAFPLQAKDIADGILTVDHRRQMVSLHLESNSKCPANARCIWAGLPDYDLVLKIKSESVDARGVRHLTAETSPVALGGPFDQINITDYTNADVSNLRLMGNVVVELRNSRPLPNYKTRRSVMIGDKFENMEVFPAQN